MLYGMKEVRGCCWCYIPFEVDFKSTIFSLCVCTEVQVVSLHGGELSDRVTVRLWLVRPGVRTPEESRGGECLTFVLCTDKRSVPHITSEDRIKS